MKIAIIEDETPALNRIKKMVMEVEPLAEIIGTADSIESAIELFSKHKNIDLALMDIELADGQSFEIFNHVKINCPIIFTTAYDEFALKAFKVNSIDYLLKPIDKDELKNAFYKLKSITTTSINYAAKIDDFLNAVNQTEAKYKKRFLIKSGTKLLTVLTSDIAYFFAQEKAVYLVTHDERKYITDFSIDKLIKMLDPIDFFQLNRQYISSIKSIQSVHQSFNGKLKVILLPNIDDEIVVSRERSSEFKKWLDAY